MFYKTLGKKYDKLYGEEQENKFRIIKENFKVKGLILDVGSGTGISKKYFKKVICLDPSIEMLSKNDVCGEGESLPFRDKSFDGVICVTAIHHIKDLDKFIREVKRVSKKDNFVFTILKKAKNFKIIKDKLKKSFKLKEIDERKDLILISTKKLKSRQ